MFATNVTPDMGRCTKKLHLHGARKAREPHRLLPRNYGVTIAKTYMAQRKGFIHTMISNSGCCIGRYYSFQHSPVRLCRVAFRGGARTRVRTAGFGSPRNLCRSTRRVLRPFGGGLCGGAHVYLGRHEADAYRCARVLVASLAPPVREQGRSSTALVFGARF